MQIFTAYNYRFLMQKQGKKQAEKALFWNPNGVI